MPEADILDTMPPAGLLGETDEARRQRLARLPIPDAMPPSQIGGATPQYAAPRAIVPTPPLAPAQPPANANPAPSPVPPWMPPPKEATAPFNVGKMPPSGINPAVPPAAPSTVPGYPNGEPELHGWRKVLDVIGSLHPLGRAIESQISGTPQNYSQKFNQAAARTAQEQELAKGQQEINAAPGKADIERRNIESEIAARGDKDTSALAKLGLTRDKDGNVVADEESPVFKQNQEKSQRAEETEKSLVSYRQTQMDLNEARTAVEQAKDDPNSPAYKQAAAKLAMAQQAHAVAAQNLGLHEKEFENKIKEQDLVKPSGQAQSRASAARAAMDVMPKLEALVKKNGAQMGVTMGRINKGELAIGNVDPDVAELYGAMKSFYALQPAVHGFRNAEFVKDFETALGTLERNPAAFIAGMKGLKPTMEAVANEGKTFRKRIVESGGGAGGGETQVHAGFEYTKGADGQWHKGKRAK